MYHLLQSDPTLCICMERLVMEKLEEEQFIRKYGAWYAGWVNRMQFALFCLAMLCLFLVKHYTSEGSPSGAFWASLAGFICLGFVAHIYKKRLQRVMEYIYETDYPDRLQ
jgi:hypothetical protein